MHISWHVSKTSEHVFTDASHALTITSQAHVGDWIEDEAASEWKGTRLVTDLISDSQAAIDLFQWSGRPEEVQAR